MGANFLEDGARMRALAHPLAQHRLRGLPEVEFGVQLSAQAFDIEQGLLQQDELRLNPHVETARGFEQPQQYLCERDFLQRLVVNRLAHGAHRRIEFIHPGTLGHPAAFDVQPRNPAAIAVEKRHEDFGQRVLVARLQGADNAEIDRRVARVLRIIDLDENIAGVHVGMKEIVAEHLREEYLDAVLGQLGNVGAARAQFPDLADDDTVYALHHHDVLAAIVPVDLRHVQERRAGKIAFQLRSIAGLAHQVQFVGHGLAIFVHHFNGPDRPGLDPILICKPGERVQYFEVKIDDLAHARTQYFDHDLLAALQCGRMHLCDGCRGERSRFEAGEYFAERLAEGLFDHRDGNVA